jgi:hypothetical protein
MKAKAALVALGVVALFLVGCRTHGVPGPTVPGATVEEGIVTFSAEGTAVVAKADDPLAMEEARIAAATIAKANLLEQINGAFITSKVTVEGLMLESQAASDVVRGWLSRATVEYAAPEKVASPMTVTAVATLRLNKHELHNLKMYVE